jgi:hypothetical protein
MELSIIITESQKRMILSESFSSDFQNIVKKNYEFVKKIVLETQKQIGINLEFLLGWGAAIGGFVGPINDFVQSKYPELSDIQLSLIITGVISTYYIDNKKTIKKIYTKIMDEGLGEVMESVLKKSDELQRVFVKFISSLSVTLHKVTNIMSYCFIIPIIPMIYQITTQGDIMDKDIIEISKRITGFAVLTISGIVLRELVFKILKRFSS